MMAAKLLCGFTFLCFITVGTSWDIREQTYTTFPAYAGVGDSLAPVTSGVTVLSCVQECAMNAACTAVNYQQHNGSCELMHVFDVVDDWVERHGVDYVCVGYEDSLKASAGFWTFVNGASNLRDKGGAAINLVGITFVPSFPNSTTLVPSTTGGVDSYILLENSGALAVDSFTWSASIYPEILGNGPLFVWPINDTECNNAGPRIWLFGERLYFRVCTINPPAPSLTSDIKLTAGVWHRLAVSYDALSGDSQVRVDASVKDGNCGVMASGTTEGPVLLASWFHFSSSLNDPRSFQGRIACMRLWNVAKDLHTLKLDSPKCQIF